MSQRSIRGVSVIVSTNGGFCVSSGRQAIQLEKHHEYHQAWEKLKTVKRTGGGGVGRTVFLLDFTYCRSRNSQIKCS